MQRTNSVTRLLASYVPSLAPPLAVAGRLAAIAACAACVACSSGASLASTPANPDGGVTSNTNLDGGAADGGPPATIVVGATVSDGGSSPDGGSGGTVVGVTVSPLTLVPSFSASVTDYYVRCASGANAVTLTVTDATGTNSSALSLVEDQEIAVEGQYFIRCLPHDFPTLTVTTYPDAGAPTPGWYLVNSDTYAMALDTNGTPVWYERGTAPGNVDALSPDAISYQPYMQGPFGYVATNEYLVDDIASSTDTAVMAVGSPTDVHEFRLLPNGDHLLLTYPYVTGIDLTGLESFGPGQTIADCVVQEIDPSGDLVWSWRASDHVDPVLESIEPASQTINGTSLVDVFHVNSIDVDASGNLLISARHTNSLFYVDRGTGTVLWKLGGTAYSKDGASHIAVVGDSQTSFNLQHDARFLPNGDVSLFDDHGATAGLARAVEYAIDFAAGTATPVFQFYGVAQSQYEGSFRRFTDGDSVVGWGYIPTDPRIVTEINASGQDVLDIASSGSNSYRAIKVATSQLDVGLLRAGTAK
jgi:hypothetical protein